MRWRRETGDHIIIYEVTAVSAAGLNGPCERVLLPGTASPGYTLICTRYDSEYVL